MNDSLPNTLSLSGKDFALVQRLLYAFVPRREVRAFGSRVAGTARKHSDLDLVVMGEEPLAWEDSGGLRNALENAYIPIRVDLLEWAEITPEFRKVIERQYLVVQEAGSPDPHRFAPREMNS